MLVDVELWPISGHGPVSGLLSFAALISAWLHDMECLCAGLGIASLLMELVF